MAKVLHPETARLLSYLESDHLPPRLQVIVKPFRDLGHEMAAQLEGPELTAGLRKIVEGKDCCVRAALG
jgi:hypothetical protein